MPKSSPRNAHDMCGGPGAFCSDSFCFLGQLVVSLEHFVSSLPDLVPSFRGRPPSRSVGLLYTTLHFDVCLLFSTRNTTHTFYRWCCSLFSLSVDWAQLCADYCTAEAYDFMGVQHGDECWCGSLGDEEEHIQYGDGKCNFPCKGNSSEICGTFGLLLLYKKYVHEVDVVVVDLCTDVFFFFYGTGGRMSQGIHKCVAFMLFTQQRPDRYLEALNIRNTISNILSSSRAPLAPPRPDAFQEATGLSTCTSSEQVAAWMTSPPNSRSCSTCTTKPGE